jgi:AcrR family transcriptional regulator
MRISKEPEERRKDLIDAAEALFLEKGYDNTAVSDIVRAVGVAQGTFYYHFKSKDDILESVLTKNVEEIVRVLRDVLSRRDVDAAGKLNEMIGLIFAAIGQHKGLVDHVHREGNSVMHTKFINLTREVLVPLFGEVVADGVEAGIFTVPHPTEAAEIILAAVAYQFDHPTIWGDAGGRARMSETLRLFLARLLGTGEGAFSVGL